MMAVDFALSHRMLIMTILTTTLAACGSSSNIPISPAVPQTLTVKLVPQSAAYGYFQFIPVSLGHAAPANLVLDTGSSGLRIFKDHIGAFTLLQPATTVVTDFNGLVYSGQAATTSMTIGTYTLKSVAVLVVDQVYCDADVPNCGAGTIDPNGNGMANIEATGSQGSFGIAPNVVGYPTTPAAATTIIYNPLAQVDPPLNNGYIVEFASHQFVLGLTAQNRTGFAELQWPASDLGTQPNGAVSWNTRGIVICYTIPGLTLNQPCWLSGPDSGGGSTTIKVAQPVPAGLTLPNSIFLPTGETLGLEGQDENGVAIFDWQIVTGQTPGVNQFAVVKSDTREYKADLATNPYNSFDIMYDFQNNIWGWRLLPAQLTNEPQ